MQSGVKDYSAVPQSPRGGPPAAQQYNQARGPPPQRSTSAASVHQGRGSIAQGVATGAIGGAYGPYSVCYLSGTGLCEAYVLGSTILSRAKTCTMRPDLAPRLLNCRQ